MIPRIIEKDFRLALSKLEKFQLDQIRRASKDSVGGLKTEDPNCEKCEKIVAKIFEEKPTPTTFIATHARSEEEKLVQKLETIDERPLVELEPKIKPLDAPPRILCQSMLRPYEIPQLTNHSMQDATFDEIACKLMTTPVAEIDKQLLDTYLHPRVEYSLVEAEQSDVELVENMAEANLVTDESLEPVECYKQESIPDGLPEATAPQLHRDSVGLVCEEPDSTWKAEHSQPAHCYSEFSDYIEKSTIRGKVLRQLEEVQVGPIAPQDLLLVPLPPIDTSISSNDISPTVETQLSETDNEPNSTTAISYQTLPRSIGRGTRDGGQHDDKFVAFPMASDKPVKSVPKSMREKGDLLDDIPLSVLLQRVRQRSKIEHELRKDRVLKAARYLSKGSCLPPLDLRPRSKTCPPKPCPSRKKAPTPPKKAIPCPPIKKNPCPPPKKNPCPPPKKDPCPPPQKDPCPPPKSPCPPPKPECLPRPCDPCEPPPPCPPTKKPCGLFTGNRIKETISLILCSLKSTNGPSLTSKVNQSHFAKPALDYPTLAIKQTLSASLGRQSVGIKLFSKSTSFSKENSKEVDLARSFDPWSPIPSWQMPKKEAERKLVCPKEGCPPTKPDGPCKEQPCTVQRPQRKFSGEDLVSNAILL